MKLRALERNWLIGIIVAVIVISLALWLSFRHGGPNGSEQAVSIPSHSAVGQVVSISGNQIQILGTHVRDDNPNMTDLSSRSYMTVNVTSQTKYVETVYPQISAANASKLSNDQIQKLLKTYTQDGSLNDLKTPGFSLTVKTTANTSASSSFSAAEIDYSTQKTVKP